MTAVSFAEAARRLGHRSRSTLYRLKADHRLNHYLVEGPDGSTLLELAPAERPTLEAYLAAVLDPGRGPQARRREKRAQVDPRWKLVAAHLSAALEGIGGPSVTAAEAELVAARLGEATREVFPEGLPQNRPVDPRGILAELWEPMAAEVNQNLAADGWRLPPLCGKELQQVARWTDSWMEGTVWDTEAEAWWRMTVEDTQATDPDDPFPDPWRCEWCGKPWHPAHPEHERPPAAEEHRRAVLERLGCAPQPQEDGDL